VIATAPPTPLAVGPHDSGYGRARLWLGMSAVGMIVVWSTLALLLDIPGRAAPLFAGDLAGQCAMLGTFVLFHVASHLPFDIEGGYLLPRRFGRAYPPLPRFALALLRGIAVHSATLLLVGIGLLLAGRLGGIPAVISAGMLVSLLLLLARGPLARIMAPLRCLEVVPAAGARAARLPAVRVCSHDEGFTGGIVGLLRPRGHLLPERWIRVVGPAGLDLIEQRRACAVETGSWRRGRLLALVFTWTGMALAAMLVGPDAIGTAPGTVELSLLFTLWSFAGLLVLPTLSRAGVAEIDDRLRRGGADAALVDDVVRRLDALQDGEPARPSLVETIFHPIPSVRSRLAAARAPRPRGYWDVARSAVFLSVAGLGLLGRAVHCNCGRPALWVFLPTD
jgi:hypothetical protein